MELEDGEEVCGRCMLVFWSALVDCPNCAVGAPDYRALATVAEAERRGWTKADFALVA